MMNSQKLGKRSFPSCRRTPASGKPSLLLLDTGVRRNDGVEKSAKLKTFYEFIMDDEIAKNQTDG